MYKLKQIPEDFIVKEINKLEIKDKGKYAYFLLKKRNYNTLRAIQQIAKELRINEKNIGFAGNKDKNAVTEQFISIRSFKNKEIELKDIKLEFLGFGGKEISLGSHQENEFFVTIRNLSLSEITKIKNLEDKKIIIPNYFGEQRFSRNNQLIGKAIVKKDFEKAIELILESKSDFSTEIDKHLSKHKNDFVVALKKIPFKLLKLYVHSYQSCIFNEIVNQYQRKPIKNKKIPIIGFGTEINEKKFNGELNKIIRKIMEKEEITFRDFIIREIPELSQEGDERDLFVESKFKIIESRDDELNNGKNKIKINFSLPKGSYATVFVDYLFV